MSPFSKLGASALALALLALTTVAASSFANVVASDGASAVIALNPQPLPPRAPPPHEEDELDFG